MFSVGQKVVLVDDKWPETVKQLYLALPVLDTVYVVRAVRVGVKADELIMDLRACWNRCCCSSAFTIRRITSAWRLGLPRAGFARWTN